MTCCCIISVTVACYCCRGRQYFVDFLVPPGQFLVWRFSIGCGFDLDFCTLFRESQLSRSQLGSSGQSPTITMTASTYDTATKIFAQISSQIFDKVLQRGLRRLEETLRLAQFRSVQVCSSPPPHPPSSHVYVSHICPHLCLSMCMVLMSFFVVCIGPTHLQLITPLHKCYGLKKTPSPALPRHASGPSQVPQRGHGLIQGKGGDGGESGEETLQLASGSVPITGSFCADKGGGVLRLVWDNSFSRFTGKHIQYCAQCVPAEAMQVGLVVSLCWGCFEGALYSNWKFLCVSC